MVDINSLPDGAIVAWDNLTRLSLNQDISLADKWRYVNDITEHVLYLRVHIPEENPALEQMHYICAFALAELVDETLERI